MTAVDHNHPAWSAPAPNEDGPPLVGGAVLPHDVECEREVLAAMLIDHRCWHEIEHLEPEDFFDSRHAYWWRGLQRCMERHGVVDEAVLTAEMRAAGWLEPAGGIAAMVQLLDRSGTSAHVSAYGQIVHERSILRQLVQAGQTITVAAYDTDTPLDEVVAAAEASLRAVSDRGQAGEAVDAREASRRLMLRVNRAVADPESAVGIRSGVEALDSLLTLQPGWLVMIIAEPGGGKTSFALGNYGANCCKSSRGLLAYELEMTAEELVSRLIAAESGVPVHVQMSGKLTNEDMANLVGGADGVGGWPLRIEEQPIPLSQLRANALRHADAFRRAGTPLGLIVFDYAQLAVGKMGLGDRSDAQQLGDLSSTLKLLAKELRVPVLMLAQPDKSARKREGGRLSGADARGAQALEADVDVTLVPRRPFAKDKDKSERRKATITIDKNRHGEVGEVGFDQVRWHGGRMRFETYAGDWS